MMKKLGILFLFTLLIYVTYAGYKIYGYKVQESKKRAQVPVVKKPVKPTATPIPVKSTESVFVPYWTDWETTTAIEGYDRALSFGLAVNQQGINEYEPGYTNLKNFEEAVDSETEKWLTIRMTDTNTNLGILENKGSWKSIYDDSVEIAKEGNYRGVVLDLELSAIAFDELVDQTSEFTRGFSEATSQNNLKFAIAMYGDAFYRKRAFDLKKLAPIVDEIMIMAYDLHKPTTEPGPNFPFGGKDVWGYDFKTMIDDFTEVVPYEKLSVIFGMYGYDWVVDEKKRPIRQVKSKTLLEIQEEFLGTCEWENCIVMQDAKAAETEVNYIDKQTLFHIVWFEDKNSIGEKKRYMNSKGVGGVVYWAFGYF